ncbi:MAG: PTS sugar transporter subunit IIA [Atopobiaceae bacterium]|jgi:PTS system fructose-specific IIA component|nr:PTS sugar transporter subunit IIA [Atopobiaceae bacterium]
MSDFVKSSQVFLDNPSTTCEEALQFISDQAVELGIATDSAAVLKSFEARESEGSTGMMGGFAIPHAKSDAVKQTSVIVVKFVKGVAWKTLDGTPVRCAIALLVPFRQGLGRAPRGPLQHRGRAHGRRPAQEGHGCHEGRGDRQPRQLWARVAS